MVIESNHNFVLFLFLSIIHALLFSRHLSGQSLVSDVFFTKARG